MGTIQASRPTAWMQILTLAPGEPGLWPGSASSSVKRGKVSPTPSGHQAQGHMDSVCDV